MNLEVIVPHLQNPLFFTIRHINPRTNAAELAALLKMKETQSRMNESSEPVRIPKKEDLPDLVHPGTGLDWASPLTSVQLYVELPFWLFISPGIRCVTVKGTSLDVHVLQDWFEMARGGRVTDSHCNALAYGRLSDEAQEFIRQNPELTYRSLRTTLLFKAQVHSDVLEAYNDPGMRRGQVAIHYLQSLACAHAPFVSRFVNAYRVAAGDSFAYEIVEDDLPFWLLEAPKQWIGIPLSPYHTLDQYPYIRDFSGTRSSFVIAQDTALHAALTSEPFPGLLELIDAWNLYYQGRYSDAIRLLATAIEIALEHVFRNFLINKGQSVEQVEKRLDLSFNNFDGRLNDYLDASERRLPGPVLSIFPYINGIRLQDDLTRNRKLRHKVVHEGLRLDRASSNDIQRAMETST